MNRNFDDNISRPGTPICWILYGIVYSIQYIHRIYRIWNGLVVAVQFNCSLLTLHHLSSTPAKSLCSHNSQKVAYGGYTVLLYHSSLYIPNPYMLYRILYTLFMHIWYIYVTNYCSVSYYSTLCPSHWKGYWSWDWFSSQSNALIIAMLAWIYTYRVFNIGI